MYVGDCKIFWWKIKFIPFIFAKFLPYYHCCSVSSLVKTELLSSQLNFRKIALDEK